MTDPSLPFFGDHPELAAQAPDVSVYLPGQEWRADARLKHAGELAMKNAGFTRPVDRPLRAMIGAIFPVPADWSDQDRAAALEGRIPPVCRPTDAEVLSVVREGLAGVVWRRKGLLCEVYTQRLYGEVPGLYVRVWIIGG